jgi:apolipoprotein D and lipocalin family protein
MNRLVLVWYGLLALGCSPTTTARLRLPPLETVAHVDLKRYLGTWYEISSFPQSFQKGCTATTATYQSRADGEIDVVNRCRKGSLDGPEKIAKGRARVVDRTTNAKLEVSFFRPFWGDYWIIALGDDYDYAVVGHPSRDYLWILSRTPTIDDQRYASIVRRLASSGYETGRLNRTLQPATASLTSSDSVGEQARMLLAQTQALDERPVDAR